MLYRLGNLNGPFEMLRVALMVVVTVFGVGSSIGAATRAARGCEGGRLEPSYAQLQLALATHYPAFARAGRHPQAIVVGFILDSTCLVVVHSAAFLPAGDRSAEALLRYVFPAAHIDDAIANGIAGPPSFADPREGVTIAWAMFRPRR